VSYLYILINAEIAEVDFGAGDVTDFAELIGTYGQRDLFMSQSYHGIDPHGAPGRDEARQERDSNQ
jgi:hypothetical protein